MTSASPGSESTLSLVQSYFFMLSYNWFLLIFAVNQNNGYLLWTPCSITPVNVLLKFEHDVRVIWTLSSDFHNYLRYPLKISLERWKISWGLCYMQRLLLICLSVLSSPNCKPYPWHSSKCDTYSSLACKSKNFLYFEKNHFQNFEQKDFQNFE